MVSQVAVQVVVSIDEKGRVVKAAATDQKGANILLVRAVETAARNWKFRPACRENVPIPSETVLRFLFSAQR